MDFVHGDFFNGIIICHPPVAAPGAATMDLNPFNIEYKHKNSFFTAQVRPCCKEDEVIYYDIWLNNNYQFTITPGLVNDDKPGWRIALKNADKPVDNDLIQTIGVKIESHYL